MALRCTPSLDPEGPAFRCMKRHTQTLVPSPDFFYAGS